MSTLIALAFATASFDLVGSIKAGSATLRIFNLVQVVIIGLSPLTLVQRDRIPFNVVGYFFLLLGFGALFTAVDFFAAVASEIEGGKGTGYSMWLGLNVAFVVSGVLVGAFATTASSLLNLYLLSFLFVAFLALIQFFVGLVGVSFFTAQWLIVDRVPRLNGFSYEPSYFSTYMLTGFVLASELWYRLPKSQIKLARAVAIATGIMILMSTSRMGILCAGVYLAGRLILIQFDLGATLRQRVFGGLGVLGFSFATLMIFAVVLMSEELFERFFSGLGLGGTADHSVSERSALMDATLEVFRSNPLIGVGSGNIGVYADIARADEKSGLRAFEQLTGMNVTYEALAGLGLVGFTALLSFLLVTFGGLSRMLPRRNPDRGIYIALLVSFLALIAILQLNQNILRAYIWTHLFVVSGYTAYLMRRHWEGRTTTLFRVAARPKRKRVTIVPKQKHGLVSATIAREDSTLAKKAKNDPEPV